MRRADKTFHLTDDDLLFITNGSCVANSSFGSQDEPAQFNAVLEKEPGSTCGDVSHGRIPHSGIRKNSSAIRRSPTG